MQNVTLAKIATLYDVLNQYTTELKPELRQSLKMLTNKADNSLRLLIKEFDKIEGTDKEAYGDDADHLRNLIDKEYEKN